MRRILLIVTVGFSIGCAEFEKAYQRSTYKPPEPIRVEIEGAVFFNDAAYVSSFSGSTIWSKGLLREASKDEVRINLFDKIDTNFAQGEFLIQSNSGHMLHPPGTTIKIKQILSPNLIVAEIDGEERRVFIKFFNETYKEKPNWEWKKDIAKKDREAFGSGSIRIGMSKPAFLALFFNREFRVNLYNRGAMEQWVTGGNDFYYFTNSRLSDWQMMGRSPANR
ncbi:MAG: hypothetical protein IPJ71_18580 [Bdellovibrionales bacterium]|nr:hypothetical protein [Bdellovibrionales bacterium]